MEEPYFPKIIELLLELYSDHGAAQWLAHPQKMLDGEKPINLIMNGRGQEVVDLAQAMLDLPYT